MDSTHTPNSVHSAIQTQSLFFLCEDLGKKLKQGKLRSSLRPIDRSLRHPHQSDKQTRTHSFKGCLSRDIIIIVITITKRFFLVIYLKLIVIM